jgi:dihydropteroate synthase
MGILNITPDSFSDGGKFAARDAALRHAEAMAADGADWIDIGAESTRPGAKRISASEQLSRLNPVLAVIRKRVQVVLSIDTTLAAVAEAALDAGVDVVNDISAGRQRPAIFPLVARRGVPIILMHMQGTTATMQRNPHYRNVTREVTEFLKRRMAAAERAGIDRSKVLLDPGIGFGKTVAHNLQLLQDLPKLAAIGRPLVVGTSRKGFLGKITGESAESGRPFGTAASVAWSAANGASIVRVHDVKEMKAVVEMVRAIRG